jgi:hypothetical protein
MIAIQNFDKVTTRTYTSIQCVVQNVVLNTSCDVQVFFYESNGNLGDIQAFTMSGEAYNNWGASDAYIVTMACQQYGLTLISSGSSSSGSSDSSSGSSSSGSGSSDPSSGSGSSDPSSGSGSSDPSSGSSGTV